MSLAYEAMMFARKVHQHQKRRYTGDPYAIHLGEVAGIVSTIVGPPRDRLAHPEVMLAVAWLHDCIEDQNVHPDALRHEFGATVADGVLMLSDLEEGNRAARKAAGRARLAEASGWVQSIKVADLLSNTPSIVHHDPKFAMVYLEEKRLLLEVLTRADERLLAMAREALAAGLAQAGQAMELVRSNANMIALPVLDQITNP